MLHEAATRRLAALMAGDIAGYSRIMAGDETGTFARVKTAMEELVAPAVARHGGRLVRTMGDGFLAEFASAHNSVACALEIQRGMSVRGQDIGAERRLDFRIGINLGDVIADGADVYGDGVNVAARLEALAEAGQIFVSAKVRDETVGKLAAEFHDLGEKRLKNIPELVRVFRVDPAGAEPAARPRAPAPTARPSIAVLPFDNLSRDPEQEFLADGITEDIITALARLSWLFVIARNSTFAYKGKATDVRQISRALGVRYVLEGSVRVSGQQIRVTGQLIDAETGNHIWAQKYDRVLKDLFAVKDDIAERVVAAVEPHLYAEEGFRASSKRPDSIDAWGLAVRTLGLISKVEHRQNQEAQDLLRSAIAMEPHYARAHALLASLGGVVGGALLLVSGHP